MNKRKELTKTESRRLCLLLLNAAVIVGITVGAILVCIGAAKLTKENVVLHQYFAPAYSGDTVLSVFRNTFLSSAIFLAVIFVMGFFSLGQPFGVAALVYKGIGIGASVAHSYMTAGIESLPSVVLLILPKAMALSFIASLSVRELLRLSGIQYGFLFRDKLPEEKNARTVKLYCIKFAVLILLTMLISAGDSILNYLLMDLY